MKLWVQSLQSRPPTVDRSLVAGPRFASGATVFAPTLDACVALSTALLRRQLDPARGVCRSCCVPSDVFGRVLEHLLAELMAPIRRGRGGGCRHVKSVNNG